MRKMLFVLLALLATRSLPAQQQDFLSGKYSLEELRKVLISQPAWKPFPKYDDRAGWAKADQKMLHTYVAQAEEYLEYVWPYIPATKSLLIARTGNRDEYQAISNKKRDVLCVLLLAEIAEHNGRFIDPIINGIWSICEESFWGAPAHLPHSKEYSGLMDVSAPFVELFSAETATYLAWADYYLGEQFDLISPQIRKRIYFEINNRIFQPLLTKPHAWMKTNAKGRRPNNWNPWICSNWLNTVLLLEKNDDKRAETVHKILTVLDEFFRPYPFDGGCDEGPGYWGAAAASLYDNISLLNIATNNAFRFVFQDEKFRNMGKFIYRAQISEKYFLNFADAEAQPRLSADMIYRYGKDIQDATMMRFGAYYRKTEPGQLPRSHFFRNFFALFMQDEYQQAEKGIPLLRDVWFPDLQVMAARDHAGSATGFYVAVKGGNNDESHNHNDIGNYVVYYNGQPLLIDVGRGTYTRKTFSPGRYEIWYNCSEYHNVPTINGKTQPPGSQFKATDVVYRQEKSFAQISLDISKAYPEDAGLNSLTRTVRLNRTKNVQIKDVFSAQKASEITQHIMTCYPCEVVKPGELIIHFKPTNGSEQDFRIRYNKDQLQASVEKVPLTAPEDKGILTKWGDNIYRINFKTIVSKNADKISFEITSK